MLDYAHRHRAVIERFGRFPHRNAILGRQSTAEELAFIATPGIGLLDAGAGRAASVATRVVRTRSRLVRHAVVVAVAVVADPSVAIAIRLSLSRS